MMQIRPPSPHLVQDTWYDKVAAGDALPGEAEGAAELSTQDVAAMHLLEAQQHSFRRFLMEGLREKIEAVKHLARLAPDSVVIITREEAAKRSALEERPWPDQRSSSSSSSSSWSRQRQRAPRGAAAVVLGTLVPSESSTRRSAAASSAQGPARFQVRLLPELLYFRAPSESPESARRNITTYTATAMLPVQITDVATGFSFEAALHLGELPMMTDHGLFVIDGNPYVIVHRLSRTPLPYYSTHENSDGTTAHVIQFINLGYTRITVRCSDGKLTIKLNKAKYVPAHTLLLALGVSDADMRRWMRNYDLVAEPTSARTRKEACERLVQLLGIKTGWDGGDAEKAIERRTRWVTQGLLGELGRRRYNERLGLDLTENNMTLRDLVAAVDLVADADLGARSLQVDDIDSLAHKRLRSVGEVLGGLVDLWLENVISKLDGLPISADATSGTASLTLGAAQGLRDFVIGRFWTENNKQLCDDTNALSELMQGRRVTQVGELGLGQIKRIKGIRLIHPTQYGRICPIETGEGQSAGVVMTLASYARVTPDGEIVVPHQRVVNGRRQLHEPWRYLLAEDQNRLRIAQFDTAHAADGTLLAPVRARRGEEEGGEGEGKAPDSVTITHLGSFLSCAPERVEYIACGPPISVAVALIPFVEHDDANRALMGAKMMQQAVPCMWPERPVVGSGLEAHVASSTSWNARTDIAGQVLHADSRSVVVVSSSVTPLPPQKVEAAPDALGQPVGEEDLAHIPGGEGDRLPTLPDDWLETRHVVQSEFDFQRLVDVNGNKKRTLRHHTVCVSPGDYLGAGSTVGEGSCFSGGELAIGKNMVVAYLPFEGYNYEDAIVLSRRCVREDIFTSIHIEELVKELDPEDTLCSTLVGADGRPLSHLRDGLVKEGTWVEEGDVLVGIRRKVLEDSTLPESRGMVVEGTPEGSRFTDASLRVPPDVCGRVVECRIDSKRTFTLDAYTEKRVAVVLIALRCRVQVGDKLAGRHGNKGIVAKILEDRDMPFLPDGTPVDVCLNPLGVPSRMNVGQIFECLLGTAGRWLGQEYRVGPFDEMFAEEASRGLVFDALNRARERTGYQWLLDPASPGKTRLYDGRTGKPYDQTVTVGVAYILKLYHMVRDKIAVRAWGGSGTGSYSMLTMQPNKGRVSGGGQRLGEMEVSALVGYGAHATLQEMMTIKSDDVEGRERAKKSLMNGEPVQLPMGATSEGYRTFERELAASGFAITPGAVGEDE